LPKIYNLSSAFRYVKRGLSRALRERRCVAAAVISGSVVSAACLWCVSVTARHILNEVLTLDFVSSKFYYCCWQLKQLRANKTIFSIFCLFCCGVLWEYRKCFNLHGKVASLTRRAGLSAHYQLHITFFNVACQKL